MAAGVQRVVAMGYSAHFNEFFPLAHSLLAGGCSRAEDRHRAHVRAGLILAIRVRSAGIASPINPQVVKNWPWPARAKFQEPKRPRLVSPAVTRQRGQALAHSSVGKLR